MCFDGTCLQEVSVPSVSDSRTHLQLKPAKPPHVTETVCDVAADLPHGVYSVSVLHSLLGKIRY